MKKALTYWGWPLLVVPTLLFYLGFGMNEFCIMHNGYQMPVRMAHCEAFMDQQAQAPMSGGTDYIHICQNKNTKYMLLGDIFVSDGGVSSIGDSAIDIGDGLTWPAFAIWAALGIECLFRKRFFAAGSASGDRF